MKTRQIDVSFPGADVQLYVRDGMDEQAIARWRQGDFEAFLALVRPHLTSLRALVACYGPPAESLWDSDDLAQDALVEAFLSADAYDRSRGDIQSWLRGVFRNRIRRAWQDAVRNHRRKQRALLELRRAAADRALRRDLNIRPALEALLECLNRLSLKSQKIVRAHYSDGLPGQEIAQRLKMKVSAVYVALHRSRRALRRCVENAMGYSLGGSPQ